MTQYCLDCNWYHKALGKPPACYFNGKWQKWLKAKSIDKPNACVNYKEK